jgi:hypothetical protein
VTRHGVVRPPAHRDVVVHVDQRRSARQGIGEETRNEEGGVPEALQHAHPGRPFLLQRLLEQEGERFLLPGAVLGLHVQRFGSEELMQKIDEVQLGERLDAGPLVLDGPGEQVAEEIADGLRAQDGRVGQVGPPPW